MKPYYQDDAVTIYHGDCREILGVVPGLREPSIRLITDPPYGCGNYGTDLNVLPPLLAGWIQDYGTVAAFGYPELMVAWCVGARVVPNEWVTWWPTNKPSGRTKYLSKSSEIIAIFGLIPGTATKPRSSNYFNRKKAASRGHSVTEAKADDVWRDPSPGMILHKHLRQHPNEKPISLMRKLLGLCSAPGETILDPFMGSGTTLRAAKDLGRKAIGIEIEERYCEIAAKRMGQEVLAL